MEDIILELKDLKKNYGEKKVLKGVNLKVKMGEIIGYIGSNGAGKSTTIKSILGMIDDYDGEIIIFGQNIRNTKGEYKRKIGYVPEVSEVYESLTADEYLNFIGQLYDLDINDISRKSRELYESVWHRSVFEYKDINIFKRYETKIDTYFKYYS